MITTTKKIAERANQPDFKDEMCVTLDWQQYGIDLSVFLDAREALIRAMYLLTFNSIIDNLTENEISSLYAIIDELKIDKEMIKKVNGKIVVDL